MKTIISEISLWYLTRESFSFEIVSSTAVMDHLVGTSFLFLARPRRPAERILTSEELGIFDLWSSTNAGADFISASETK